MYLYIVFALALIIILLADRLKTTYIIFIKKLIVPVAAILFIVCLLIFSETSVNAAYKGLKLWFNIVFPSLFPFFVASELLNGSGIIKKAGKLFEPLMRPFFNVPGYGSFPFAMGITSGYPVGAKITARLRKNNLVSKIEAERLLTFTNNSGPLFIMGAVAVGMFKRPETGVLLFICHILSSITVGIIFRNYKKTEKKIRKKYGFKLEKQTTSGACFSIIFGKAVRDSIMTLMTICGFIVFFSVLINLLTVSGFIEYTSRMMSALLFPIGINEPDIKSVLSGVFEITSGVNIASSSDSDMVHKLTAVSMILGWAGLSVHSQVAAIISDTDISIKPYIKGKLLHGIISALYTYTFLKISNTTFAVSSPVFSQKNMEAVLTWNRILPASCRFLGIALLILLLCILTINLLKKPSNNIHR